MYYDVEGNIEKSIASYRTHVHHLEDYWLNCEGKHEVRMKKYERMTLGFARMLKIYDIPDQLVEDHGQVLNQFYNNGRIYDEPILDPGVEDEDMTSIDDFTRPVIKYTQHCIDDFCKILRERGIEPIYSKDKRRKQREETTFESREPIKKKRKTSKATPGVRIEERTPETTK